MHLFMLQIINKWLNKSIMDRAYLDMCKLVKMKLTFCMLLFQILQNDFSAVLQQWQVAQFKHHSVTNYQQTLSFWKAFTNQLKSICNVQKII